MPLQTLPLIAWGTPDDMTSGSWSTPVGTLAAITTTTDPFGGSLAYTLNDTDGAVASRRQRTIAVTTDGVHALFVAAKAGTAAESQVIILETTGGNVRGSVTVTWSGPTFVAGNGGTFYGPVAMGNSWYGGILLCAGLTVANGPAIAYRPSGSTGSATGSASFYLRHIVLTDYLVDAIGYDEDGEGSDYRRGPSGTEEAWSTGTTYGMSATIGWIPSAPRSNPVVVSGWPGGAESIGVNDGIAAMLRAGRNKNALTFIPDRSACSSGAVSCYLEEPLQPRPELDPDNQNEKRIAIRLRSSSSFGAI